MAYHQLILGWERGHASTRTATPTRVNSFEILFLSTKTIKRSGAFDVRRWPAGRVGESFFILIEKIKSLT